MLGSVGSGIWAKMMGRLQHLLQAGGLSGEIRDVRQDIAAAFKPTLAVAIEEYDYPDAAGGTAILAATASTTAVGSTFLCNGAQGVALSPPRNVQVVVPNTNPTHMNSSVTVYGLDAQGKPLNETITGLNGGGGGTYAGAKCFALVEKVVTATAGSGTNASFTLSNGAVIGLSQTPKLRSGQTLGLCRREIVDGGLLSSNLGALTAPATNPPYGAYTPYTAVATQAPAVATAGTVDMTTAGLYGGAGSLDGTALWIDVNGAGSLHLALSGTGNAASEATLLAALRAEWPGLVFAIQAVTNFLLISTVLQDESAQIIIAADVSSTANPFLGLTAGTYNGAGHRYSMEYEYDASLTADPQTHQ